ncbi:MAG TPA: xanthine dehydrogenase accessory protein XdhC [Haliangium sp.]|nr:xanthine dehydrogenase accessory protein XdhC [Haliangium sp.]
MKILSQAVERAQAGERLALVTVLAVRGSAPRHEGTKMLVNADGAITGTIGGGRIEQEATAAGAEVAAGAPARRLQQHLVHDLAMCCGGSMELYIEPVAPSLPALRQAVAMHSARRPALLITPLDGGPKRVEEPAAPAQREPVCEDDRLIEPLWPPERVVLFGAGHVSRAVAPLAAEVGFEVVVCDDDETGALGRLGEPSWVSRIVDSFEMRDVEAAIGGLGWGDYVLVVTRDHALDERILERVLPNAAITYLGLIGSRGKVGRIRKRLAARDAATDERWARLHAPIGLDIGAETPAEIAVAVVAQLIHVRRRGTGSAMDFAPVVADPPGSWETSGEARVDVRSKAQSEHRGED